MTFLGSKCRMKLDLAFLLDGSGTMKEVYPYAKVFIMMLAEEFHLSPNHTHIGIIVFSETAEMEVSFGKHQTHDAFKEDVDKLHFLGKRVFIFYGFSEQRWTFKLEDWKPISMRILGVNTSYTSNFSVQIARGSFNFTLFIYLF